MGQRPGRAAGNRTQHWRLLVYYTSWVIDQGKKPTGEAAMSKLFCNQFEQRLTDVATKVFGPLSEIKGASPWAPMNGQLQQCYLWSPLHLARWQYGSFEEYCGFQNIETASLAANMYF